MPSDEWCFSQVLNWLNSNDSETMAPGGGGTRESFRPYTKHTQIIRGHSVIRTMLAVWVWLLFRCCGRWVCEMFDDFNTCQTLSHPLI